MRRLPLLLAVCLIFVQSAFGDQCSDLVEAARELLRQERYEDAVVQFELIRAECTPDQRTLVEMVHALHDAGRYLDATGIVDSAIAMNPYSHWAGVGHYYRASACSRAGCANEALDSVQVLRTRFPESAWTTRAEAVEAEIQGSDSRPLSGRLAREEVAEAIYQQALADDAAGDGAAAMVRLNDLIANHSDTRTGLAALGSEAFIGTRDRAQNEKSVKEFEALYTHVATNWAQARITNEVGKSLAHLYQRLDRPGDALNVFDQLLANSDDPAVIAYAAVEGAGAAFEVLQKRQMMELEVMAEEWDQLRNRLASAASTPDLTPLQQSRVDLMVAESYHWQDNWSASLAAAESYLERYDVATDRSGVGTAHIVAGEALRFSSRIAEGLEHFQWVIDEFQVEDVWPQMAHANFDRPHLGYDLARARYWEVDGLYYLGAPVEEVIAACDDFISRFPDTVYAEMLTTARADLLAEQGGEK